MKEEIIIRKYNAVHVTCGPNFIITVANEKPNEKSGEGEYVK